LHVERSLHTAVFACVSIFAGEEINLHDLTSNRFSKDKGLLLVFFIPVRAQDLPNRPVASFGQFSMVQCQIHIDTTNVLFRTLRNQQLGNPATNQDWVLSILAKNMSPTR
jgi:hypothetical protein